MKSTIQLYHAIYIMLYPAIGDPPFMVTTCNHHMCSPYVDPMAPGAIGDPPWLWVSTMAVASLDTKSRQEVGQVGAKALRQDRHNMAWERRSCHWKYTPSTTSCV